MKYQLVLDTIYITTILVSLYHRHHLLVSYYSQFNYHVTTYLYLIILNLTITITASTITHNIYSYYSNYATKEETEDKNQRI